VGHACVLSRAQVGLTAPLVRVEVHVGGGLPQFSIVGLAAPVVRESKDRVRAALASGGYDFPAGRLTVNLAPAELPKEGGRFDLPIALGILIASGQLRPKLPLESIEFYGELSLTGSLKAVQGLLLAALHAGDAGHSVCAPTANGADFALADTKGFELEAELGGVVALLAGRERPSGESLPAAAVSAAPFVQLADLADLAEVRGQEQAKRALMVAATGGHHLLLVGPPGAGKSMLAQRLPGLLPQLELPEHREVAAIHSLHPAPGSVLLPSARPPFRAPHHTASAHAIVGGGPRAAPGEISLAHHGVLFLDELPEFDRRVLEALREPLETGSICIARADLRANYPAQFQLVAAMNECPCGKVGGDAGVCECTAVQLQRYRARLSGPLLDRIDLLVHVAPPGKKLWQGRAADGSDASAVIAARVRAARERQHHRQGCLNARLSADQTLASCRLDRRAYATLRTVAEHHGLSARGAHRLARVARSIADLEGAELVNEAAVAEALSLRRLNASPPKAQRDVM
jgi:magnesium chelatase family protein